MTPIYRRVIVDFRLVEALRDVLRGITAYLKTCQRNWRIQCLDDSEFHRGLRLRDVDGALVVVTSRSKGEIRRILRSNVPTVNMLHDLHPALPSVLSDDKELGRCAARYFLARGFKHFAFTGVDTPWSVDRQSGFAEILDKAGLGLHLSDAVFRLSEYRSLDAGRLKARIKRWLSGIPLPFALLAGTDVAARAMLTACEEIGLRVPEEVAILGVDNLVVTCEFASVPLSSVAQDFPKIGFEAARLLDRLMEGGRPPRNPIIVPPGHLEVRRSTDSFAFEDRRVSAAMRMIHERAGAGMSIKMLASELHVSRKWLDQTFKEATGATPSAEIRRVRLGRVNDLLLSTDCSIKQIAGMCGFSSAENLIRFFRQAEGLSPQRFRSLKRGASAV